MSWILQTDVMLLMNHDTTFVGVFDRKLSFRQMISSR